MSAVEPVAIVGIGCRLPGGVRHPDDLWNLLAGGVDAITEVPKERWNLSSTYHPDPAKLGERTPRRGGFLDHIDRSDAQFFGISPRRPRRLIRNSDLAGSRLTRSVEDAGLTLASLAGRRRACMSESQATTTAPNSFFRMNARVLMHTPIKVRRCVSRQSNFLFLQSHRPQPRRRYGLLFLASSPPIWHAKASERQSELAFRCRRERDITAELTPSGSPKLRCFRLTVAAAALMLGLTVTSAARGPASSPQAASRTLWRTAIAFMHSFAQRQEPGWLARRASRSQTGSQKANIVDALRMADIAPESVQYVEAHGPARRWAT